MESVTKYQPAYSVKIVATEKTIEAIKHIVNIAPQEAQWFHTVEVITRKSNDIELHLSEKLYIPKQNTSLAEVNSTSNMMIDFYNTLKKEYADQSIVNQKLAAMTCWCHSHHNMAPNPSGQDQNQFAEFVNQSIDQNTQNWQIMLIFNKKGHFYSKVFDPINGIVTQGVPIVKPISTNNYNFDYITKAAKEKFIKPKPIMSKFLTKNYSNPKPSIKDPFNLNEEIASDLVDDIYESLKTKITPNTKAKVSAKKRLKLADFLCEYLDSKEYLWLLYYLNDEHDKLLLSAKKAFASDNYLVLNEITAAQEQLYIDNYFTQTTDNLNCLKNKLASVLSFCEASSYHEVQSLLVNGITLD